MLIGVLRNSGFPTQEMSRPESQLQNAAMTSYSPQDHFRQPPPEYGPVPFYWWAGEKLERGRIAWQLDQLREKGVRRTVISYPHAADGRNDPGDPALFSPEWWELFRWFLAACRERGMTVGFQDYTLVEPILQAIGRETPGMQGGQMSCAAQRVSGTSQVRLSAEQDSVVIGAWAYPVRDGLPRINSRIALSDAVRGGVLEWSAPAGEWFVALVFARTNAFDPLHPDSGRLAIGKLYEPFDRECPGEVGRTLNLFFQDELDFGCRMPFWSNQLFEVFAAHKGYDLHPLLPALWHDMGPLTEKIRLDYSDTVVTRLENCYFKPVFHWHEERGTLFGHDNSGRGRMAEGRFHYGDYFRTMRWFSAPGCDDPKLHGPRAFKGLKVNSSIAHLYQRPRVWIEAFHSSGWGTQPAEVSAALNEDFAYGATVVNLHGLYYSTCGGWWEWAPPDFHFRQPYWEHSAALNESFSRLSWLLSQGTHRCDVAIVYPIDALDAEAADPALCGVIAHMGNENIGTAVNDPTKPEDTAFVLGKHLFDHACDFDFIDFESIASAEVGEGEIRARTARYRVLVFPAMRAVRYSSLVKARDFVRSGGLVIAFGCLPKASDRAGRDDAELDGLLAEIFGSADDSGDLHKQHRHGGTGVFLRKGYARVLETLSGMIERDVVSSRPMQVLHRDLGELDVYFVFNPADETVTTDLRFRCEGSPELWDARNGRMRKLPDSETLRLTFAPRQAKVVVFNRGSSAPPDVVEEVSASGKRETLDGPWNAIIQPTLDNRHGDFSLPASPELLGPQTRRFRYCDEVREDADWHTAAFDDSSWPETTFSFGPQLEFTGPLPPESDFAAIEAALLGKSNQLDWQHYCFSRRWGIERDPFLTDWLSGPHGLKGAVPDEFLDFHSDTPGTVWYLRAKVVVPAAGEHRLMTGARCAYQVWVNNMPVARQDKGLRPGLYAPWSIPHYECEVRETRVLLQPGINELLIKLAQPAGQQRTRAFVAFDPPQADPGALALRWFSDPVVPRPCLLAPAGRRAIRFRFPSPPGARELTFVARGPARAWAGGSEIKLVPIEPLPGGCYRYRGIIESPSPSSVAIALRVEAPADSHAGDTLPEPVRYHCGPARMTLGDWCAQGLATYSGAVCYSRKFEIADVTPPVSLDLGMVNATAEVKVNGQTAATLLAPPWTCDLTPFLRPGENELSITVANTLANHYSVGIPTPYAFSHQTPSGLFGPVSLITAP
jgi:hypothetical protein